MSAPIPIPPEHVEAIRAAEALAKITIAEHAIALGLGGGLLNDARMSAFADAARAIGIDPNDPVQKFRVDPDAMTITKIVG